jgi:hypothetical protein
MQPYFCHQLVAARLSVLVVASNDWTSEFDISKQIIEAALEQVRASWR